MRILVLCHEYPPIGGGGGRVAQDLCRALAARGHLLQVVTAHWGDLPRQENEPNLGIHRVSSGRKLPYKAGFAAMLGYILAAFWRSLGLIRSWKPDLIHVHFAVPAGVAAFALSLFSGTPYVLTAHLGDVPGGVPEKTGKWFRWIFPFTPSIWRRAGQVVAVSAFTRSLAQPHYPVDICVIPNGVDLKKIDPGELHLNQPLRVVFAGRFVPQKNPLQLVQALAEVRDLPWTCTMAGDGPLKASVEAEIARCGLQERFRLPGWVSPEEVLQEYARSDILCMPSLSEGLPVVGVQALAMGLALVLSKAGGNIDLVQEGQNGFLLAPDDLPGFSAALRALLNNPQKLLDYRRASRRMAEMFDLETVVKSYEQIFTRIKHS